MVLKDLKEEVWLANLDLPRYGLVKFTWGNVSGFDKNKGYVVIKPSGIPYSLLKVEHLVVLDLDGNLVEGSMKPSSDTPTHLVLYKEFPELGGVVHTHSPWATAWAQAGKGIPALGTTHADYFNGEIPCTRKMTESEVNGEYEKETGKVIVETFKNKSPLDIQAVLVKMHGIFTWGTDANNAVHNAVVLEEVAKIAFETVMLNAAVSPLDKYLLKRHYFRKHGSGAYYGQS